MQNLFWLWLFLMPFLSVSPWQVFVKAPFYYGFAYYLILLMLNVFLLFGMIRNKKTIQFNWQSMLIISYVVLAAVSLLINWNIAGIETPANASGMTAYHVYNIFILFYLIFNASTVFVVKKFINNKENMIVAVKLIAGASALASIWGIAMVVLHISGILRPEVLSLGDFFPRLMGSATEPQVFGNFLILGEFLSLYLLMDRPTLMNQLLFLSISLAMIMTFSVGAWMGAAAGLVVFLLLNYKSITKRILAGLAFILIIIVLFLSVIGLAYPKYSGTLVVSKLFFWKVPGEMQEYKITKSYPDDKLHRTWMAQAALNMFKEKPVLGVGLGNYGYLYNKYRPAGVPRFEFLVKAHNAFLEILAETGILGFLAFSSWLILIFYDLFKDIFSQPPGQKRLLLSGIACAGLGLMLHGFGLGIFAHNYTWIALGLAFAAKGLTREG